MARKTKQAKLEERVEEVIIPPEPENIEKDEPVTQSTFATAEASKDKPASGIFDEVGELVVDVFETSADFVVSAAIAGIQIKDLDISLEKDMMVIKGDRCNPHSDPDKKYFYQECYWGPFSRKIILPENIDIDKADAQIDKGILTVKIPKNEPSNGKIGVKIS
ncbi:MAG: Hsp20 family protein [Candidatus Staskawiczbacteria bacterium]|nr:Hsp20 family protein [Candidatus Staskawiczbacteria bacterium]